MRYAKKRWVGRLCTGAAVLALLAVLPASATAGYPDNRLVMIAEPGDADGTYVRYFRDGEEHPLDDLTWVDGGRTGKAVLFDGSNQYLTLDYNQLQMQQMTFSAWVNWYGDDTAATEPPAESSDEDASDDAEASAPQEDLLLTDRVADYGQRLFTFFRNTDESWMTFAMHAKDPSRVDEEGKSLDGAYFGLFKGDGEPLELEHWQPAGEGESWGIPAGEWHHIAFVTDAQTIRIYIDGQLWYSDILMLSMFEMRFAELRLGGNVWDDTPLHALLDNVFTYDFAMSEEQILMLARDADPLAEGAEVPTTTAPYIPTAPSTTATTPQEVSVPLLKPPTAHATVFGLPVWTVAIIGVILGLFVILTIGFAVYDTVKAKHEPKGGGRR